MRTILLLAGLLAVGAVPVTAAAQHGAAPAPAAHAADAPKPAPKGETAVTHAAAPAAKPVEKPAAKAAEKAAEKPAAKPAEKAAFEKPAEHASGTAAPVAATAKKAATTSDLEAAFDRIAQKIGGSEPMPGGLRIASGAPARAADVHATKPRAGRVEATPRILLTWRSSLVWPAALGQAETHDSAPVPETSRIPLVWP